MIYVPEILQARLEDNKFEAKRFRNHLMELDEKIEQELDLVARAGMEAVKRDIYFEYESLSKENEEIKMVLKLIKEFEKPKNKQKKRASSLSTGRLNSHKYFKSHASL